MSLISLDNEMLVLQRILEAKLLRVFYYTRYSLLLYGQDRLSHHCFFTNYATQALEQSREIMRALVLLDVTCDLNVPYGKQDIQEGTMAVLLKQAIDAEKSLLSLCQDFLHQVKRKDIYFCRLARSLVIDTHQRIVGLVHWLCEVEGKTEPERQTDLPGSFYTSLNYSSLRAI